MIVVEMWKAREQCRGTAKNESHAPVANCENSGKVPALLRSQCRGRPARSKLQHEIRRIHNGSPQLLFSRATDPCGLRLFRNDPEKLANAWNRKPPERPEHPAQTRQRQADGRARAWDVAVLRYCYCSASIKRVMVRLSSLSERRISSILLME